MELSPTFVKIAKQFLPKYLSGPIFDAPKQTHPIAELSKRADLTPKFATLLLSMSIEQIKMQDRNSMLDSCSEAINKSEKLDCDTKAALLIVLQFLLKREENKNGQ